MKSANAGLYGEVGEFYRFRLTRVENTTDTLHQLDARIDGARTARLTTQTGTKAGLLCGIGQFEEPHVFATRPARRT